jgi:hypothetical protein
MRRKLATALTCLALTAFVAAATAPTGARSAQTNDEVVERTGSKRTKPEKMSCPIHPEIKARTAGKCAKCRIEERKQKESRGRDKNKVQENEGSDTNE